MKPLKDRVIIFAEKPKEQTASGLYVVEEWKTLPPVGVVEAIGPDVIEVKVGDKVLFERYASVILKDDRRMCKESHVLAVLEN